MSENNDNADPSKNLQSVLNMDAYLKKAIPMSIVIASIKTAILKPLTTEIVSIVEKNRQKRLTKEEKAQFEKVIRDVIANLPASKLGITDAWKPESPDDLMKTLRQSLTSEKQQELIQIIVNELKGSQTRIGEFLK